ncbi:hypothetical protein [Ferrimonas balearica]|uniref:hypothetical protein n=1 Tax=Ferrimonas balearica TaxID=44012 RepID=UPI001C9A2841|nr:hypothetical protein [Ferrimonas balearica]MBY5923133.1 hypothetical protein [Ferrimonas balearica]MBY5997491.1 hypothetical protein [Ferrimonas balearica]
MKGITLLTALLVATPTLAAESIVYHCALGKAERVIEVQYPEGGTLPCEVHYTKAEGSQILWSAQNSEGYCEQRAANFVEKQEGWGWRCSQQAAKPE